MNILFRLTGLFLSIMLIGLVYYVVFEKKCDVQTSIDVKMYAVSFISSGFLLFFISLILKINNKWLWVNVALLTLLGILFFLFDYFNILVEYDTWLGRGMPTHPFCK